MTPQCEKYEAMLASFIDGQTAKPARTDVQDPLQNHLNGCPRCRHLAYEQTSIRHQLRLLAQQNTDPAPSLPLWERAAAAWDTQDKHRHRALQIRWTLASVCMLTLLLSVVWARVAVNHEFPIDVTLRDFSVARTGSAAPFYATADTDKAARWLQGRLNSDLPPINLSLSRAELLGADVLVVPEMRIGRLLYRTPQGVVCVYVVPGGTRFAHTSEQLVEDRDFHVETTKEAGLYGWEVNGVGYALLLAQPVGTGRAQVINAEHASEQPGVSD